MPRRNVIQDRDGQVVIPSEVAIPLFRGTWTNMPAASTEVLGNTLHRVALDLSPFDEIAIFASVAVVGAAGSFVDLQFSVDNVAAYANFPGGVSGPFLDVLGQFIVFNQFFSVPASPFKTDRRVFLRLQGQNGDGIADPTFAIWLLLR